MFKKTTASFSTAELFPDGGHCHPADIKAVLIPLAEKMAAIAATRIAGKLMVIAGNESIVLCKNPCRPEDQLRMSAGIIRRDGNQLIAHVEVNCLHADGEGITECMSAYFTLESVDHGQFISNLSNHYPYRKNRTGFTIVL